MVFLSPALAVLRDQLNATYPGRDRSADGWIGDAAHASRVSDHNPDPEAGGIVRALDVDEDLHGPSSVDQAGTLAALAAALIEDPRTRYVIYESRIWANPAVYPSSGGRWRPYTGSNPHTRHLHLSVRHGRVWDHDATPWQIGARMHSPIRGGRVTSPYGTRNGTMHAGMDIAPTTPGRAPVYATFAGTIERLVRGRQPGDTSRTNELAPYRTGNGARVRNPDGETQLYGHVDVLATLKAGSKIAAGDLLGYTDLSGTTTGHHVHYEEWTSSGATRDPQVSFDHYGITPGADTGQAAPALAPEHRDALTALGYATLTDYQTAQGLHPDGIAGPITIAHLEDTMATINDLARDIAEVKNLLAIGRPVAANWYARVLAEAKDSAKAAAKDSSATITKLARKDLTEIHFRTADSDLWCVAWWGTGTWARVPTADTWKRHNGVLDHLGLSDTRAVATWEEVSGAAGSLVHDPAAFGRQVPWPPYPATSETVTLPVATES
ncbi:peptidoglycan DD-metalloendopeptidase family protein [Serinibacter salmoneus]|uniref:Peptidase M23-like protein n=1 Tax=Serinibacter salmoneus TaxID=556530 RepID=A0A2A9CZR3_9MICO|nr:M23 family metallopeptidase [Serinibacter salmoneus]PFG19883.1 peptidase M23-like protein [Serinibacter salmoneus]